MDLGALAILGILFGGPVLVLVGGLVWGFTRGRQYTEAWQRALEALGFVAPATESEKPARIALRNTSYDELSSTLDGHEVTLSRLTRSGKLGKTAVAIRSSTGWGLVIASKQRSSTRD